MCPLHVKLMQYQILWQMADVDVWRKTGDSTMFPRGAYLQTQAAVQVPLWRQRQDLYAQHTTYRQRVAG